MRNGGCFDGSRKAVLGSLACRHTLQEAVPTTQVSVQCVRRVRVRGNIPAHENQSNVQNDVSVWSRDDSGFSAPIQQMGTDRPSKT